MSKDFDVIVRIVSFALFLLIIAFSYGMAVGQRQEPTVCQTHTQHHCLWVNGTSSWQK